MQPEQLIIEFKIDKKKYFSPTYGSGNRQPYLSCAEKEKIVYEATGDILRIANDSEINIPPNVTTVGKRKQKT